MMEPRGGEQLSAADAAEHIKEKHLQMVMDAQQHGRPVRAVPIDPDIVGEELARTSVEASQKTMKRAVRRSFLMPGLPWRKS